MSALTYTNAELQRARWERAWTRQDRSPSTFADYWRNVSAYLVWCENQGTDSAALDPADMYVSHVERSNGAHAARWAGRAIKAYGKYLAAEYEQGDPFKRLKLPPEPAVQHAPTATTEDVVKLLAACTPSLQVTAKPWDVIRDQAIIVVLAGTGMRRGEVANMQLGDLNLIQSTLKVPKSKSKQPRTVYLPEDAVGALMKYLRASEDDRPEGEQAVWMGALTCKQMTSNGIGQMLYRRGKAAGVDVRAHAFRRMFASAWMAQGGSEVHLRALAGWKSNAMIERYTKNTLEANAVAEAQRLMG